MAEGGAGNNFYTRCQVLDVITADTYRVGITSYIRSDAGYEVIPVTRWTYFYGSVVTGRDTIFIPDGCDEQDRPRRSLCPGRRNSSESADKKKKKKGASKDDSPGRPGSPGGSGGTGAAPFRRTFYILPTGQRNGIAVTGSTQGTLILGPHWIEIGERSGILNGSQLDPPVRNRSNSEPGPVEREPRPPLNRQGSDLIIERRCSQISLGQRHAQRHSPPCSPRSSSPRRNTIPTSPLASSVRRNPKPRSPLATPDRRRSVPNSPLTSSPKEKSLSNSPPTNSSRRNMQSASSASSSSRGNSLRNSSARRSLQSSVSEASSARGSSPRQRKETNQPVLTAASPNPDEIVEDVLQEAGYATASRPNFWTRTVNKLSSRSSTRNIFSSNRSSATVGESNKAEPISSSSSSDTEPAIKRWCISMVDAIKSAFIKSDKSGTSRSREASRSRRLLSLGGSSSASGMSPEFSELSSSDLPETETSEVSRPETPEKRKPGSSPKKPQKK